MKLTRYLVIAAGALAVLVTLAWFLRDSLIERLSNPLLDDYGLAVVDVSLDALATSDASIGYLELRHEKGTSVVIEDLTLPYAAASKRLKTYRARKVSIITATRTDGAVFDIAELIQQALSLPGNFANSVIIVDELSLPPYPTVRRVRWEVSDSAQQLQAAVEAVDMSATVTRVNATNHAVIFSLVSSSARAGGNVLDARLHQEDAGYSLKGGGALDLPAWQPLAKLIGIVPPEVELLSGTATLTFDVNIPHDVSQTPSLSAGLLPSSPLDFSYRDNDGDVAVVHFQSDASAGISATFPDVDWSLGLAEASLQVSYGAWQKIPVSLRDINCKAGPTTCSIKTRVALEDTELPIGTVATAAFSSSGDLHFQDTGLRLNVRPGASLTVGDLASGATALEHIQARLVSDATLDLADDGWRVVASSVDAEIGTLSVGEATAVSMPLFLENISAERKLGQLSLVAGAFAPSARATWTGKTLALPGVKGRLSLNGSDMDAELRTVGLHKNAAVVARHSFSSGSGQARVDEIGILFDKQSLSERISPWPRNIDIVAGALAFDLSSDWAQTDAGFAFGGQIGVAARDLAGYFGDYAFTGLSTDLSAELHEAGGVTTDPSRITVALIDVGVPLENLSANYTLDMGALGVDVSELSMSAFGGAITADPFSFRTAGDANTVVLNTETLNLAELLSLEGFEALEVTGSVNARLPVTIEGETVTIAHGNLTGNAPGGVIRYRQARPPDKADTSGLGFAKRVLSNFEYTTLVSDVDLSKEGDLKLKLKLTGRNPDMDEKRPVVLNVDVENNIPQMLRSLRAARAVEDVLEKRLVK